MIPKSVKRFSDKIMRKRKSKRSAPVSIEFLITSFIVVASPGTGVLFTLAAGLSRGSRASVVAAFGCTIGIVPHMAAAIMGLAALLHTSALAFQIFKYLGVAYLLYMAWSTLQESGVLKVEKDTGARSDLQVTVTAILINILNPKLSIFFLAFLPQFVSADDPHAAGKLLFLGLYFIAFSAPLAALLILGAERVIALLKSRPRVLRAIDYTFAGLFGVFALKILTTQGR